METSLSPREIQARIRGGASIDEVAEESGSSPERITVFASPVIAEREHIARTALGATVRRRGDGKGHRRLREIISDRLRARSIDPDWVTWDAWREPDLRWRVVGTLDHEDNKRVAEFLFDPKARFSVTDNSDARWMIGEELIGGGDPDGENTVDFNDELALVRAIQSEPEAPASSPGDEVPVNEETYPEPPHTSELDDLYDMLSGVSEDSVRIYVGLEDEAKQTPPEKPAADEVGDPEDEDEFSSEQAVSDIVEDLLREDEEPPQPEQAAEQVPEAITEPQQDSLIEEEPVPVEEAPAPKKSRRKRAQVPSWDEIMFGGPTTR